MTSVVNVKQDAVNGWFGLSYANYLTVPRVLLEEMPDEWQNRFVALMDEMRQAFVNDVTYEVRLRDERGRYRADPLASYRHPDWDAVDACRVKEDGR